ncbi:hypothetical protein N7481_003768 [Penicillium waksmanii]|uniref:uncharacterized protein n=1 Tax=Penicillium waksmanii TaxID=69791 RepID=UPI0025491035|nr:uncharacterized protein N7481_003768 [Penicillium waksmanii]KAJ5988558.1 hypothetical protein N7481_003768 [Penicillium waksmanii]
MILLGPSESWPLAKSDLAELSTFALPLTPEALSPEGSASSCPGLAPSVRGPQDTTCLAASGPFEMSAVTFPTIRMVNKAAYPDAASVKAKVSMVTQIENSDEETLLRSVHPSLRDCPHVAVIELLLWIGLSG